MADRIGSLETVEPTGPRYVLRAPAAPDRRELLHCALAGAIAVWVMDRFDWFVFDHEDPRAKKRTEAVRPGGMDPAHAVAAKAAHAAGLRLGPAPAHQHPAGLFVHYAVPMGLALLYHRLRQRLPIIGKGGGVMYGAAVFVLLDEIVNPVLGLAARPSRYPIQRHAREFATHLIYGAVIHAVLKLLRGRSADRPFVSPQQRLN